MSENWRKINKISMSWHLALYVSNRHHQQEYLKYRFSTFWKLIFFIKRMFYVYYHFFLKRINFLIKWYNWFNWQKTRAIQLEFRYYTVVKWFLIRISSPIESGTFGMRRETLVLLSIVFNTLLWANVGGLRVLKLYTYTNNKIWLTSLNIFYLIKL